MARPGEWDRRPAVATHGYWLDRARNEDAIRRELRRTLDEIRAESERKLKPASRG